jgi:hypothetical protein
MQKLHFFPTGIDMISIEVQTSQPYTARYILAAGLSSVYFFWLLCFVLFVFSKESKLNPHIFPEPLLRALIKVTTARTFPPPPSKLTGYSCDGSKQSMRMRCWHASATARFGCIAETPPPAAPPRGEPKPCRAASRGLAMR